MAGVKASNLVIVCSALVGERDISMDWIKGKFRDIHLKSSSYHIWVCLKMLG